jgi:cell division protein FtsN
MASKWAAEALNAGPFWIGKDREKKQSAMPGPKTSPKARVATKAPTRVTAPGKAQLAKQPVRLRSLPMQDNWFVFVDTYDSGQRADEVISTLNGQGLDAKVAVESRSGELFYRVQIVGIENETTGNTIVSQLRADAFKNARLRKTVN